MAPDEIDPKQLEKILNFKNDISDEGIYFEYSSLDEFEELIENNLRILAIEKNYKEPQPTKKFEKEKENEGVHLIILRKLKMILKNYLHYLIV